MRYSRKVIAVARVPIQSCPASYWPTPYTLRFDSTPAWEELSIRTPADLTITAKMEEKQPILTAKLEFRYCGEHFDRSPSVYLVTLASGAQMVLGTAERPYPVALVERTLSSGNSTSALPAVTVTWSVPHEIPCLAV